MTLVVAWSESVPVARDSRRQPRIVQDQERVTATSHSIEVARTSGPYSQQTPMAFPNRERRPRVGLLYVHNRLWTNVLPNYYLNYG
jgi:hypothetical protein